MKKKAYEQPTMKVVKIQQTQMLCGSVTDVTTNGLDDDLGYDKDGGDLAALGLADTTAAGTTTKKSDKQH